MKITIKNWKKHQHYNKRRPPWIKMYRDLLDDRDYRTLSDSAARLLIDLWLLASEQADEGGSFVLTSDDLAWRLRDASKPAEYYDQLIKAIENQGFITIASNVLAPCEQDATPETETETEVSPSRKVNSSSSEVNKETGEILKFGGKF